MSLTLDTAATATNAAVRHGEQFPERLRVVTDTRTLQPGDTFLALRGENFDGHAYVREAVRRGAVAIVIDDPAAEIDGVPTLLVSDTKRAYMAFANAMRQAYRGHVIAITGSAGKTTTKHLLAQLLAAHLGESRVLASPANENNEIGVSKLLLRAGDRYGAIVVEMGARHYGEIAELVAIAQPQTGILTNIGEAHLEMFGSRERLAKTKWGLFAQNARAVLNANDATSVELAHSLAEPPLWFGAGEPTDRPGLYIVDDATLLEANERVSIHLAIPGAHNRANVAAAIAAARHFGVPMETIVEALPDLTLPSGRYESIAVQGFARIIYDAYNANMSGMLATLEAFSHERGARRIAVLASMAELGAEAPSMHERVGETAAGVADVLLVGGEHAASLARGAERAGLSSERIVHFATNAHAAEWLRKNASEDDVVLLKGSRVYKLEEIVRELQAR